MLRVACLLHLLDSIDDSFGDDLSDGGEFLDTETEQKLRDANRIRRISIPLLKVRFIIYVLIHTNTLVALNILILCKFKIL